VAHDSHNIVAVGSDDYWIARSIGGVTGGGLKADARGPSQELPLPVAGIMSHADAKYVAIRYGAINRKARKLCHQKLTAPFMTLSFMALLVIPELKLSDKGLFSTTNFNLIPLRP